MGTPEDPHTAHTLNPIPFVYLAPGEGALDGERDLSGGYSARGGGALADVAPTLLEVMGIEAPAAMTGESLLE
jgi:2,3-bisphosphoglycerate-independent phosphoglycerate mutase